ncbi:MAG: LPS export ABC transporter permease LptG [Rhodobacteraceae bacterium]|nr:LPS export ABC transporter permease LptG [Paracoccaceae bacterium]
MMLHLYFGRRFLHSFLKVSAILALLIFVIEWLENIRGLSKYGVSFAESLILAASRTPSFVLQTLPIIVMLSALAFCVGLARSNEFVISRAVGVSALSAMAFPAFYTFTLGLAAILVLNPLAATFSAKHTELRAEYTGSKRSAVSFGEDGFWLRQKDEDGHTVIHAQNTNRRGTSLRAATALKFNEEGAVISRLFSNTAILNKGQWIFTNGKYWHIDRSTPNPEKTAETFEIKRFDTDITPEQILEGYPKPNTVPIWDMPQMIRTIQAAGFSSLPHMIHFNIELARPLMLVAMIVLGAAFTLQNARLGNLGVSVFLALVCGFALYFLQNLAMTLGEAGEIPVFAAAWAPPLSGLLLALGMFLKFEDG